METVNDVPKGYGQCGYMVATDKFMSGWGKAPGSSYYAVAVRSMREADDVEARMRRRDDFIRVRYNLNLPRGRRGDHLHVVRFESFTYGLDDGVTRCKHEDCHVPLSSRLAHSCGNHESDKPSEVTP